VHEHEHEHEHETVVQTALRDMKRSLPFRHVATLGGATVTTETEPTLRTINRLKSPVRAITLLTPIAMETYTLYHFPPSVNTVHIALFEDVSNAPAIRKRLIQAATTEGEEGDRLKAEVDFGFLEGRMVRVARFVSFRFEHSGMRCSVL
jgi:hypothetical protein